IKYTDLLAAHFYCMGIGVHLVSYGFFERSFCHQIHRFSPVYQRRSKRRRRMIAAIFITARNRSRTIIAPDVRSTKARSASLAHMNICTGNAVAGSMGVEGTLATKATMPISSKGAVSPKACANPI